MYFYCNRAEENRREPESILNTLIQQLAQSGSGQLLKPVVNIYQDRESIGQTSSRLSLVDSENLLVQLTNIYPQTTICIDALDEVDNRIYLLDSLKRIMERSDNLVKIFATSRMDPEILVQFEMFSRIELKPDDIADDIGRFIQAQVARMIDTRSLIDGKVNGELKDEICHVLHERSKGMYARHTLSAGDRNCR